MGYDGNGPGDRLNVFALVIYIPDPLAKFLDDLRVELVPDYVPHAHVSVLPPRPISVHPQLACEYADEVASRFNPFEIELTRLSIFKPTDVIYLELGRGTEEICRMHDAFNGGALRYDEPYSYHPHVTVAQEIGHDAVDNYFEHAQRRWKDFSGPKSFEARVATFVQNEALNRWVDLAHLTLGRVPSIPVAVR